MSPRSRGGGGDTSSTGGGGDTGNIGGGPDTGIIGGGTDSGTIDGNTGGNPDSNSNGDNGYSYGPPSAKNRQPGTLNPLTVGTKKAIRDGAMGVNIAFTILSAHQLITALMKLLGVSRRKGFQRTTKFRLLMVLTTATLVTIYALGIAYTGKQPEPWGLESLTQLITMQLVDDFLAKVAQWLVFLSAVTLIYDYAAYKASADASLMNVWAKDRPRFFILYVLSPVLAITGAVQLAIFMIPLQRDGVFFSSEDVENTEEVTRKVVAWVFLVCFAVLILALEKTYNVVGAYVPELKNKGLKFAILFLKLLAVFFLADSILITADDFEQSIVKLAEIVVVGGLTCSVVWSLLWESDIKPASKTITPG